uniref:Uncharacterized protein n=1 Tax=Cacopsylla melanoneura TaxID=428564 RepID=A0A8D8PMK6_9HEMI
MFCARTHLLHTPPLWKTSDYRVVMHPLPLPPHLPSAFLLSALGTCTGSDDCYLCCWIHDSREYWVSVQRPETKNSNHDKTYSFVGINFFGSYMYCNLVIV